MKHIERFRKMINLDIRMEWRDKDPFLRYRCKFDKVERECLTKEEAGSCRKEGIEDYQASKAGICLRERDKKERFHLRSPDFSGFCIILNRRKMLNM